MERSGGRIAPKTRKGQDEIETMRLEELALPMGILSLS